MTRALIAIAGLLGAVAVAAGAFGAHGLRDIIDPQALDWWKMATSYLLTHMVGVLALAGLSATREPAMTRPTYQRAALCMVAGAVVFSATLYAMALGAPRWFGAVTPVGGVLMIAGWLLIFAGALQRR